MAFQVGDRVRISAKRSETSAVHGKTATVDAYVEGDCLVSDRVRVTIDHTNALWLLKVSDVEPYVDTFPIPAERDPWRETEPYCGTGESFCARNSPDGQARCNRACQHAGHHVARFWRGGEVRARWPQEPIRNDEVAVVEKIRGTRGPLAEDVVVVVARSSNISGSSPAATAAATGGGDLGQWVTLRKLARALFDYEHEPIALRLADHADARNDKQAFLDRAWVNASAEDKRRVEWIAAILLKRATEMP
jgi:hypothetical protein